MSNCAGSMASAKKEQSALQGHSPADGIKRSASRRDTCVCEHLKCVDQLGQLGRFGNFATRKNEQLVAGVMVMGCSLDSQNDLAFVSGEVYAPVSAVAVWHAHRRSVSRPISC